MRKITNPDGIVRTAQLSHFRQRSDGRYATNVWTLNSAPTSSTLSITDGQETYNFKPGDEVRVRDTANGSESANYYIYYKLHDIKEVDGTSTAYWKELSSGSGSDSSLVLGRVQAVIEEYRNGVKVDGSGLGAVTVELYNTSDSVSVATKTVTGGGTADFQNVTPLKSYEVRVTTLSGYALASQTATVTGLGIGETAQRQFMYKCDAYTIAIDSNQSDKTDIANAKVTVGGTQYANGDIIKIAEGGTLGTPSLSAVNGYSGNVVVDSTNKTVAATYNTSLLTVATGCRIDSVSAQLPEGAGYTVYDNTDAQNPAAVSGRIVSLGSNQYKIALGTPVKVVWDDVAHYQTPDDYTATYTNATSQATPAITASDRYYAATTYTVSIDSNQSDKTDIAAVQVGITDGTTTTSYTGRQQAQSLLVPANVTISAASVTAPAVSGYHASVTVSGTTVSVEYQTTVLTVTLTSDTGNADLSGVTVTVTDTTAFAVVSKTGNYYLIPSGHGYSVSVSDNVEGYSAPAAATGTAGNGTDATATVTMTYEEQAGFVDLGISVKWAQANIVKDSSGNYKIGDNPEDYGCYFSWGNIDGHNSSNGSSFDDGYSFSNANYDSSAGKSLMANIASNDAAHDAALARLGSPWRMPTSAEFKELYDNTDREWTTINGIKGWKFMKKTDHSVFIFLPAAGYGSNASLYNRGSYGGYWSSTYGSSSNAYGMYFYSSSVDPQDYSGRRSGFSVRAVQ